MTITVSGYNRPAYLAATLNALSHCDGVRDCTVTVLLDPCEETQQQINTAAFYDFEPRVYAERQGCNLAIGQAFSLAFSDPAVEFHLHLEDDTVPTRDALRWFAWARDRYRDDPSVMSVSGYQRISNGCLGECGLRRWFTPWGWGVWRDRWLGLARGWEPRDPSWDVIVNHALRAGRFEAYPRVSRIQNIGAEKGTHVPSAEWHEANHRVAVTSDDLEGGEPVAEWIQTKVSDAADHA